MSKGRRSRHCWPAALVIGPPVVLGLGVAAVVVLSVLLAVLATVAALAFSAAVTLGIFGALGFVAWQIARHTIPGLARTRAPRKRGKRSDNRGDREPRWEPDDATPVDLLRRRYAAGEIGQTAFRQQLTDLLKERYVRGDLTMAEFESRVRHLYQDPALRPPAA